MALVSKTCKAVQKDQDHSCKSCAGSFNLLRRDEASKASGRHFNIRVIKHASCMSPDLLRRRKPDMLR